jgi:hypothetical protein
MTSSELKLNVKISPCQQLTGFNRSAVIIWVVSWRGESREVPRPSTIAQLKIKDGCILDNLIEFFWQNK